VQLINNGKSPSEIVKEYNNARSTLYKWATDYNNTKSFKAKDNSGPSHHGLKKLSIIKWRNLNVKCSTKIRIAITNLENSQ